MPMRRRLDGGVIHGAPKGQRVRRRRPRAVTHRGEPADGGNVVVVVRESVGTVPDVNGEVAGWNPVLVEEELVVVPPAAAQLDASKRDPAGRDARSAPRGIEPATRRANVRAYRRALERRRVENPRAAHDFPGDQPTSHRPSVPLDAAPVVRTARRPVVVILREHGIDEFRATRRVLSALFRPFAGCDVRKSTGKRVPARVRTRHRPETPPIALRRRNRVRDLHLAVPGERGRGDERGGERARTRGRFGSKRGPAEPFFGALPPPHTRGRRGTFRRGSRRRRSTRLLRPCPTSVRRRGGTTGTRGRRLATGRRNTAARTRRAPSTSRACLRWRWWRR